MTFDIPTLDRGVLRNLLVRWQRGEITFYQVVEEAEVLEDQLPDFVLEEPLPSDEPRFVPWTIFDLLTMGFSEPLFVEEVPHLLTYLDTPSGQEAEASERLSAQLNKLTLDQRLERAEREYSWERDTAR